MLPLPRITSISRPSSVLAVYSTFGAIPTRACHVDTFYGSRSESNTYRVPDKPSDQGKAESKKPIGERALGLVAAWEPAQTGHLSFDEARSPMGLRVRFCELQRVTKPSMGGLYQKMGTECKH